jgi:hypothetical protein
VPLLLQIHEDHGRLRTLYKQYQLPTNTTHQKQLLALDIIRHSSMHSKKEDMVRTELDASPVAQCLTSPTADVAALTSVSCESYSPATGQPKGNAPGAGSLSAQ